MTASPGRSARTAPADTGRRRPRTGTLAALILAAAVTVTVPADPVAAAPTPAPAAAPTPAPAAPTSPAPSPGVGTALAARAAEAARLRRAVDRLNEQAEAATEDYNAASDQLTTVVADSISAQQRADALRRDAGNARHAGDARVRALYMSGGVAGLYASVFDGGDLHDVLGRMATVRSLVRADGTATLSTTTAAVSADVRVARLAALADRRVALQGQADAARLRVQDSLTRAAALLADADASVRLLAEQQRAAAAARAAQVSAAQLAGLGPISGDTAPTARAAAAVAAARSELGAPYVWGAVGPDAYDCSGLMLVAYRRAGVFLPRTSREQWYAGPRVALADLQPGDLLFWAFDTADPGTIHHVAMYAGNGRMVHAPRTGALVQEAPVYLDGLIGAVRPTARAGGPA